MFDITDIITLDDSKQGDLPWYVLEPSVAYPTTIQHIVELIDTGDFPHELVDNNAPLDVDPRLAARNLLAQAKKVPAEGWVAAMGPKSECPVDKLEMRSMALETARLWFTQALQVYVAGPVGVHILKDEDYKL